MNKLVLEAIIVFLVAIFPDIFYSIAYLRNRNIDENVLHLPRLIWNFAQNIVVILLIGYVTLDQQRGLSSVGLSFENLNFVFLIVGGFLLHGAYVLIYILSYPAIFNKRFDTSVHHLINIANYQTFLERTLFIIVIFLSVIGEELVYRGYLVLYFSEKTGILWPWVVLTLLLSVVVHLYQGIESSKIYAHFLFAVTTVIATILTESILLAISTHLILDTLFIIRTWRKRETEFEPSKINLRDKPLSTWARFIILFVLFSLCTIIGSGYLLFSGALTRMSPVYQQAIREINTNTQVIALFGGPVETYPGNTSWDFSKETGNEVKMVIFIEGAKESGVIDIEANKLKDKWIFTKFTIKTDRQEEINLLDVASQ